jgi:coproporphyrinogen III oxidase-like Fe-S oxidoreductase
VRDHGTWAARLDRGESAIEDEEVVTGDAAVLEQAWLQLRTWAGALCRTAGQRDLARIWRERGLAAIGGDRVTLTPAGWLILDKLAVDFADRDLNADAGSQTLSDPRFRTEACSTG